MPNPASPFPPAGIEPGERWRAPYACRSSLSRGRLIAEPVSATRGEFQRDRDRIIHSTAFRRLKHKTQVFVSHEGDHYRTRLTHTIEVAQIARALARALGLDEDLAEALALAHDLGHTPFGHTGEDALDECMAGFGGFDHNAQTLRIVTRLERRYADFDGLNLSWETLEGLVKHNGPLLDAAGRPTARYAKTGIPAAILEYQEKQDLWLDSYASAEAQVAALADDIAYNAHDIDDGLRAGLFGTAELRAVPFLAGLLDEVERLHPGLDGSRQANELVRRVITRFVEDVIGEAQARLAALAPADADAIRRAQMPVVAFSAAITAADRDIKGFLYPSMYRHPRIVPIRTRAAQVVRDLFARFSEQPGLMPDEWAAGCEGLDQHRRMRRIADYIAGMTDWYALDEHRRLFDATPSLR
ncbi:deoxyguanosinetriphosphate triphosphohydrolase [Bosea sp. BH3]|uniref:deoxyguanosinetriphosphate triphosphohydrolase n=1 Tax=Bosea sp. BH3 TaxID=2871701 RepID=UPI0021CB10FD|nr:deoxyguanosinetriphosphate triphosphohydrolase [Bosea sp. BH3]MCU4182409.1 deoxyguanosinetriphosphate triphosphohydrolase [Bosea sp. BH3]